MSEPLKGIRVREDLKLILAVVLATYIFFTIFGAMFGLGVNEIVGELRRITFYGAVFGLAALALNLHWGYTGLFNIGIAGFMAVGVYVSAILTASPEGTPPGLGLPLLVGIAGGVFAAGLVGLVAALPALRISADYFAIVTLGLAEIIRLSLLSRALRSFEIGSTELGTGGGSGISSPPSDVIVDYILRSSPAAQAEENVIGRTLFALEDLIGIDTAILEEFVYVVILVLFVLGFYWLLSRIAFSPFGRVLKAIREDEIAAQSLGKNTDLAKITAFVLGCALMATVGILWQGSRANATPGSFMPLLTFWIFVALIIGGSGSNTGAIIGGFVFSAFLYQGPRFIRSIVRANFDIDQATTIYDGLVTLGSLDPLPLIGYLFVGSLDELRYVVIGIVLIVLMIKRPEGLLGHRKEIAAATDISRPTEEVNTDE